MSPDITMPLRALALAALLAAAPVAATAQTVSTPADLKRFDVTVRRFDPAGPAENGQLFVLPVDSPDAEHAIASTLANAAAFSAKTDGAGHVAPVAFMAVKVERR